MQAEFWKQRWETGQIGFNQAQANPFLHQFWPSLGLEKGARVLVPLCGKSLDMTWLVNQGFSVVGVELSQKAVESYYAERLIEPQVEQRGPFQVYSADYVEIWCGDFFGLSAQDIGHCAALYDRAALIALPEPMRERYVAHLQTLLPASCAGLLITLDYEQDQLEGPPFSVPPAWVKEHLTSEWHVTELAECDVLQSSPKALLNKATRLDERAWRLVRRG